MNELVSIVGIIVAAIVVLVLAYLYRESALIEGKTEWGIGPLTFKLGGKAQKSAAQKPADAPQTPVAAPEIIQTVQDGAILDSPPEIQGGKGRIEQTARDKGVISGSGPKIS